MSQPQNFGPDNLDPLAIILKDNAQLIDLFRATEKDENHTLLGIEYEIFGHDAIEDHPLPYEGERSISSLFLHIVEQSPTKAWEAVWENSNVVALNGPYATIALEPGGQIEIAMKASSKLKRVNDEFLAVVNELTSRATELNISLFAIGIHPFAKRSDMAQVKKKRYAIMQNYMQGKKGRGLDMMTRTCSIQLNLDFRNEQDMVEKTRLAASLMPFCALLCSSSAYFEGHRTKLALERCRIWRETDTERTGFPAIIFAPDFGYQAWIDYALDVPMYFIRRDSNYIDVSGSSFRDFMAHGLKGEQALVRDFVDHLTTIFTEVRLKPFLELRSCDCLPAPYVTAFSALCWALFYDEQALAQAQTLFVGMTHEELNDLFDQVIEHGRAATFRNQPVFAICAQLLQYADQALKPHKEDHYLKPFHQLIASDITCAEWLRQQWPNLNANDMPLLIKRLAPLAPPLV